MKAQDTARDGFTLYLDRAGLCTPRPTTEVVGRADTQVELCWLARGAAHFERGGRLWATDDRTGTVLYTADMKIAQRCENCDRTVEDCNRTSGDDPCTGRARRAELERAVDDREKTREAAVDALETAVERRDAAALERAAKTVLAAYRT